MKGDDDSSEKSSQNKLDDLLQYIDWRNKSDIDDEIKKFEYVHIILIIKFLLI